MFRYEVLSAPGANPHLVGATLAIRHLGQLQDWVTAAGPGARAEIVLIDFSGIESATSSYLKGLVLPVLRGCAGPDLPALGYPVVTGLREELRSGLCDVLHLLKMTCLNAELVESGRVARAIVLGNLDPALVETLEHVVSAGTATATGLHAESGKPISVTAWNNRLSDLHARGLVRRHRAGKQWVYESLAEEIVYG